MLQHPDGSVYIADWTDVGECHENDGVHRTSGRIYRVAGGNPDIRKNSDVESWNDDELLKGLLDKNEAYSRLCRRVLQEKAATGQKFQELYTKINMLI